MLSGCCLGHLEGTRPSGLVGQDAGSPGITPLPTTPSPPPSPIHLSPIQAFICPHSNHIFIASDRNEYVAEELLPHAIFAFLQGLSPFVYFVLWHLGFMVLGGFFIPPRVMPSECNFQQASAERSFPGTANKEDSRSMPSLCT